MVDIRRGRVANRLSLHTLSNNHSLNLLGPIAPLGNIKPLAIILRVDMWLLRSYWGLSHLDKPTLHVKLTHVKNAVSSSVLVCSGCTCSHASLHSPLVIHLDGGEKASGLLVLHIWYSGCGLNFSRLWPSRENILSLFVLIIHNLSSHTNLSILSRIHCHIIPPPSKWHRCLNSNLRRNPPLHTHFLIDLSRQFFKFLRQLPRLGLGCFELVCYNFVVLNAVNLIGDVIHLFVFFVERFVFFRNDLQSVKGFDLGRGYRLGKLLLYVAFG